MNQIKFKQLVDEIMKNNMPFIQLIILFFIVITGFLIKITISIIDIIIKFFKWLEKKRLEKEHLKNKEANK